MLKIGRTQLQDAVPMTLGQEFSDLRGDDRARTKQRLREARALIQEINLGATAIGTGINAPHGYAELACRTLAEESGVPVMQAPNLVEATQDTGAFVQLSGVLKRVATKLSKTCNDLRLLSSGPQAGFGDIKLPPRQAGSSIMPGKVNPVIPEVMNQVAFEVIGNDMTVTMASEAGQLQLNAFEPIMGWSLYKSIRHLANACITLQTNCVAGIEANHELLARRVRESVTLVTALNPIIGYEKAALIAKTAIATGAPIDEVARVPGHHDPRADGGAAGAREADAALAAGGGRRRPRHEPCFLQWRRSRGGVNGYSGYSPNAESLEFRFSVHPLRSLSGDLHEEAFCWPRPSPPPPRAPRSPRRTTPWPRSRSSGAVTMGVRESSGALSYTLGDGKFAGFHVEICQRILAELEKPAGRKLEVKYQPVTSQNRIPLVQNGTVDIECGSTTNNASPPEGRGLPEHDLRRGSAHRRQGQLRHQHASPS